MARKPIAKSPQNDRESRYSESASDSLPHAMLARLRIHQRQMIPGRTLYRRQPARSSAEISPGETGRGPISDISPRMTFRRAGSPVRSPEERENSLNVQP